MEGLLEAVFSAWSLPRSYVEDNLGERVAKNFAREAVKFESERLKQESPLLGEVARERLKIQQAGKDLEGVVVICEL
jgi:hypothetical protein